MNEKARPDMQRLADEARAASELLPEIVAATERAAVFGDHEWHGLIAQAGAAAMPEGLDILRDAISRLEAIHAELTTLGARSVGNSILETSTFAPGRPTPAVALKEGVRLTTERLRVAREVLAENEERLGRSALGGGGGAA